MIDLVVDLTGSKIVAAFESKVAEIESFINNDMAAFYSEDGTKKEVNESEKERIAKKVHDFHVEAEGLARSLDS